MLDWLMGTTRSADGHIMSNGMCKDWFIALRLADLSKATPHRFSKTLLRRQHRFLLCERSNQLCLELLTLRNLTLLAIVPEKW